MIFHPEEINSLSLVRYMEDSFYNVFLFRIYLHGSNAVHEENVVKTQLGYYSHYYVRKLYSVYILSRHCLINNDYREPLLNTDKSLTTNISLYSDSDKHIAFFYRLLYRW